MIKDPERYAKCGMQYDINFTERLEQHLSSKNLKEFKRIKSEEKKIQKDFVKKFNKNFIKSMKIEDYVSQALETGNKDSFCYILETRLEGLGNIKGTPVAKFGVYYSNQRKKIECTKKFSKTQNIHEAFENIKDAIIELIELGKEYDLNNPNSEILKRIDKNPIAPIVKGKILYIYYPDKFISAYTLSNIEDFLRILNINYDCKKVNGVAEKGKLLLEFKENDPNFSKYENLFFTDFLYKNYGEFLSEESKNNDVQNRKVRKIDYTKIKEVNTWDIKEKVIVNDNNNKNNTVYKYSEDINKRKKTVGNRGEEAIYYRELDKLKKINSKYAKDVEWIAKNDDTKGYDIKSYDENGNEIHIEVKTYIKGNMNFYISDNEYQKLLTDPLYKIYYINNAKSETPNLYILDKEKLDKIYFKPVCYQVQADII